jgi:alkylhydroperoxidase/carboxymuconolactone decarboxylase family protein YurZ
MKKLPTRFLDFSARYPACAGAYEGLAAESRKAAGYSPREAELIKLALSIGARLEGAAHSHARRALAAGVSPDELRGVALLALATCGFPQAMIGLSWVEDVLATKPAARREKKTLIP